MTFGRPADGEAGRSGAWLPVAPRGAPRRPAGPSGVCRREGAHVGGRPTTGTCGTPRAPGPREAAGARRFWRPRREPAAASCRSEPTIDGIRPSSPARGRFDRLRRKLARMATVHLTPPVLGGACGPGALVSRPDGRIVL